MSDDAKYKEIADLALETIREEVKGFVEREELDTFAKEKAAQYAKELALAAAAGDGREKQEHLNNLKHLRAQVKGEFARLNLKITANAKVVVERLISGVFGILEKLAPKLLS
jgi:hypothetical protein